MICSQEHLALGMTEAHSKRQSWSQRMYHVTKGTEEKSRHRK